MFHSLAGISRLEVLDPIASLPGKKNECGNQSSHDKHPVLAVEAQQVKT
jgi:hypothetical protein